MDGMLTVAEAAKMVGCHPNTLRNWAKRGLVRVARDYRNHRLFEPKELERLKDEIRKVEPEEVQ
jgi:putative resolvase